MEDQKPEPGKPADELEAKRAANELGGEMRVDANTPPNTVGDNPPPEPPAPYTWMTVHLKNFPLVWSFKFDEETQQKILDIWDAALAGGPTKVISFEAIVGQGKVNVSAADILAIRQITEAQHDDMEAQARLARMGVRQ